MRFAGESIAKLGATLLLAVALGGCGSAPATSASDGAADKAAASQEVAVGIDPADVDLGAGEGDQWASADEGAAYPFVRFVPEDNEAGIAVVLVDAENREVAVRDLTIEDGHLVGSQAAGEGASEAVITSDGMAEAGSEDATEGEKGSEVADAGDGQEASGPASADGDAAAPEGEEGSEPADADADAKDASGEDGAISVDIVFMDAFTCHDAVSGITWSRGTKNDFDSVFAGKTFVRETEDGKKETLTFNEDGTYTDTWDDAEPESGTWEVTSRSSLRLYAGGDKEAAYIIAYDIDGKGNPVFLSEGFVEQE